MSFQKQEPRELQEGRSSDSIYLGNLDHPRQSDFDTAWKVTQPEELFDQVK